MHYSHFPAATAIIFGISLAFGSGAALAKGPDDDGRGPPAHAGKGEHGPMYHAGKHDRSRSLAHGHQRPPILEFEIEGKGVEIEFKCRATIMECLEAAERVHHLAGTPSDNDDGNSDRGGDKD